MPIKLVIYDLDGVITSTSKQHFDAWKWVMKKNFGISIDDKIEVLTKGVSRIESLHRILNEYEIDIPDSMAQQIAASKNEYYKKLISKIKKKDIFDNIIDQFEYLKSQNIKIALGSASKNATTILKKLKIMKYFDYLVNPSDVLGKPEPDIFLDAMKRFGCKPEECIGIEDSVSGIKAIKSAGMYAVGIGDKTELHEADIIIPNVSLFGIDLLKRIIKNEKRDIA